jgi:hypothetical protein
VRLRRRPPAPCPCRCGELADGRAKDEALLAAIVRVTVALRPIAGGHSIETGLTGWGAKEKDARLLAEAIRQSPA